MVCVSVNVKWGKEVFKGIDVDMEQPPLLFKTQLFALTSVPIERQKIMVKGGMLGDDDWGKVKLKANQTLMLMGTAEVLQEPPKEAITFLEDLPEDEQSNYEMKGLGAGLQNLGNTCYMNSTLQCLFSVSELRDKLASYVSADAGAPAPGDDGAGRIVSAVGELYKDMERSAATIPPYRFLMALRQQFPQFNQTGQGGVHMQQDAEECWTSLLFCLGQKLKEEGKSAIEGLFGIPTRTVLKCAESDETIDESSIAPVLKCNITIDVNHLHEGIALALKEDREKNSEKLGRMALFAGNTQVTDVPPYLTLQMMRFFYKADVQQKAKILRKVSFTAVLDLYDFATDELKATLQGPRDALKAHEDLMVAKKKGVPPPKPDAGKDADKDADKKGADKDADKDGDSKMEDAEAGSSATPYALAGQRTGRYNLIAVLTHKGRSADSGHYVAWVKQKDGSWILFDDDQMIPKKEEDILALSGGGDWHMSYMMVFKAETVPSDPDAGASAEAEASAPAS